MYSVQLKVYNKQCTIHREHCTVCSITQCTVFNIENSVQFDVVYFTCKMYKLYKVPIHCTVYMLTVCTCIVYLYHLYSIPVHCFQLLSVPLQFTCTCTLYISYSVPVHCSICTVYRYMYTVSHVQEVLVSHRYLVSN